MDQRRLVERRGKAIMTPSPNSPARPSCGWTTPPASSSGTRSSHATRSRSTHRAWRDLRASRARPVRRLAARLTVNSCLDLARRRERRVIEVELTEIDSPLDAGSTPGREPGPRRRRAPATSTSGRAIVVLHYYLGMPLTDVAATLGHPDRHGQIAAASRPRRDARGDAETSYGAADGPGGQLGMSDRAAPRARPAADPRRARRGPLPRLHRRRPRDHGATAPAAGAGRSRKVAPR